MGHHLPIGILNNGGTIRPLDTITRIGLWLCAFVVSVALFSLLCCLPVAFRSFAILLQFTTILRTFFFILQFMALSALPGWLFCLPVVIAFKDVGRRPLWILLTSGTLIGPACLIVLGLIVQLGGGDARMIWLGDGGIGLGIVEFMPFAFGLGFLTTLFYVIGLRVIHRRSNAT